MEITDDAYRKIVLELAAARGGDVPAPAKKRGLFQWLGSLLGSLLWIALIGVVITVFAFAARVQYGLPIPLPDGLVATASAVRSGGSAEAAAVATGLRRAVWAMLTEAQQAQVLAAARRRAAVERQL